MKKSKKKPTFWVGFLELVPREGLEPPRLTALGSKPSVSANFTSGAIAHI